MCMDPVEHLWNYFKMHIHLAMNWTQSLKPKHDHGNLYVLQHWYVSQIPIQFSYWEFGKLTCSINSLVCYSNHWPPLLCTGNALVWGYHGLTLLPPYSTAAISCCQRPRPPYHKRGTGCKDCRCVETHMLICEICGCLNFEFIQYVWCLFLVLCQCLHMCLQSAWGPVGFMDFLSFISGEFK